MIKYRIILAIKKFFKNKLNYIIAILIGFSFSFSIVTNSLSYSAAKYFKSNVLNFVSYRQFFISANSIEEQDKIIKKLKSIPEIAGIIDNYGYMSAWKVKELEDISEKDNLANMTLSGTASEFKADIGENLSTSTDENYIVCPSTYYSDSNKTVKIDLTSYIGKNLTLKYIDNEKPREVSVKLIGLYDNDRLNQNYRRCYINYNNLSKFNNGLYNRDSYTIYYELKNIVYEEQVTKELQKAGFYPEPVVYMNRTLAVESIDLLIYINYGLTCISLFVISCIIIYNLNNLKDDIKIYKICGYSNKNLILNYMLEILNLFILGTFAIIIFLIFTLMIFRKVVPILYPSFKYVKMIISPSTLIFTIITFLLLCILINFINYITIYIKRYNN